MQVCIGMMLMMYHLLSTLRDVNTSFTISSLFAIRFLILQVDANGTRERRPHFGFALNTLPV